MLLKFCVVRLVQTFNYFALFPLNVSPNCLSLIGQGLEGATLKETIPTKCHLQSLHLLITEICDFQPQCTSTLCVCVPLFERDRCVEE